MVPAFNPAFLSVGKSICDRWSTGDGGPYRLGVYFGCDLALKGRDCRTELCGRGGRPLPTASSSSPFSEVVALGAMAIIAGGKFTLDSANMKSNRDDVNARLYPNYRKGWAKEDLKV